ncbi:MAG: hypothetical protein E3J72_00980 [Planctomycetota bacterium]|nr:MAG: hypothetical protein E3J72_00980 [Planctomycetota bacterium]
MKHKHSFNAVSITHFIIILIAAIGLTLIPSCSDGHKSSRSGGGGGGGTGSGTGTGTGTGPGTINGKISNSPNKPASWSGASSKGLDYIRSNWKNSGYPPPAGPIVSASYCGLAMLAAGDDPKSGALKDAADYVAAHITDRGGGGNDFDNWGFSIGSWFLSEMALHTGGYKSELESGIGMLETHQLSNGGYAHGPTAAPKPMGSERRKCMHMEQLRRSRFRVPVMSYLPKSQHLCLRWPDISITSWLH